MPKPPAAAKPGGNHVSPRFHFPKASRPEGFTAQDLMTQRFQPCENAANAFRRLRLTRFDFTPGRASMVRPTNKETD
jgi:hypothetical protein